MYVSIQSLQIVYGGLRTRDLGKVAEIVLDELTGVVTDPPVSPKELFIAESSKLTIQDVSRAWNDAWSGTGGGGRRTSIPR